MKKRSLRFGLITACLGFSMIFLSVLSMAGQPGKQELNKSDGSRLTKIRANQHTGAVNLSDVMNARQQADALRTKSIGGTMNLHWVSAGPDNYSGLIHCAIFDNQDPKGLTVIAGSESGGIWKSINMGLTWNPMAVDNNSALWVSSMVQTSGGTIYAATGITSCKKSDMSGTGIYVSQSGGSFTLMPNTKTNPDFLGVTRIALDHTSGRLYAATIGGLYYCDNGIDWVKVRNGYTMDVCVGPDGSVLTAAGDSAYLAEGGNLNSWKSLTTGKPNMLPKSGIGWMSFAIAPSDGNIMYACLAKPDGNLLNLYNSVDKGANWSIIFPANPAFEPLAGSGCYANTMTVFPDDPYQIFLGGENMWRGKMVQPTGFYSWEEVSYGFYSPWVPYSAPAFHHSYMFNPVSPNKVVMATDGGVCIATILANGIDFQTSNKELKSSQFLGLAFSSKKSFVMGGGKNIGTLAMGYYYPTTVNGPTEGFPVLTDGLIMGTDAATCAWSNLNYNIGVFTVAGNAIPIRRQDFRDISYTNDFMNFVTAVDKNYIPLQLWESFTFNNSGDSVKLKAYAAPIPADSVVQLESANGIKFSYKTTVPIAQGDSIMVVDPVASRYFVYGNKVAANYGYGIYMTKDMLKFYKDPEYFVVAKDTASKVDIVTSMAVSADLNTLWAGTAKGRLIRVTGLVNAHDSATANEFSSQCVLSKVIFSSTPFTGRFVTAVSIDPKNSNNVLVTLGNYGNQDYVYFSTNATTAQPVFSSVQSNLPKAPVYSGLIELSGTNAILGTEYGVYSTNNLTGGNPQWGANADSIGDVIVTDIRQQVLRDYHTLNYGAIYIATYGRGIWMDTTYMTPVGIEPVATGTPTYGTLGLTPNPARDQVVVTYSIPESGNLVFSVYDITGRRVAIQNFGFQPKGTFSGTINLSGLPSGNYFIRTGTATGKVVKL